VRRQRDHDLLVALGEHPALRMAEHQGAQHVPDAGRDRHGQVADERQMVLRREERLRDLGVAGVRADIVEPQWRLTAQRLGEERRLGGHRELFRGVTRRGRERAVRDACAGRIDGRVEERAERGAAELRGGVDHGLGETVAVGLGVDQPTDATDRADHVHVRLCPRALPTSEPPTHG
jgi:hypothetical protein